ncbi:DUF2726 domain-containing protein [Litorimonas sp. WD9-15]|uniref:DUF2726 domain-containing protein n=1 Tax=Litorimonas sp. WD9-15 TaxID=3418716 RepID=UPI003D06DBE0
MELLALLILSTIALLLYLGTRRKPFAPPAVSPITDRTLDAFEAAPSLWVNGAERGFFLVLLQSLPRGYHLHGKVRLEDIIRVKRNVPEKARWTLRGRVKSRHVDYLITDSTGRSVLAIELDGAAHDPNNPSEADRVKTALFAVTDIPLRRVRVGEDFHLIAATIATELNRS